MISILVYGRNDERGYGMHKRVALSLNAMASQLDEGTAEIVFVDYNTPDHLPTLPELIRDTLTETARRRTRVVRVRPRIHHRFAELTELPVLEPIARNIGLRRTRRENRWILCTNTDSIIAPLHGRTLVGIAASLGEGHYVLPRYELPERVWESFDRLDPEGAIRDAQRWGREGRLDEAVRGEGVIWFDAPGDFQLVRRADLFRLDGFDEEMLLGWHVDYNLAHRLQLALGPPASLSDQLKLYHCGHARQATATHSHDRIENDVARFVHGVSSADLPHQRDRWGCPSDTIEEIDLSEPQGERLLRAVAGAVRPLADSNLSRHYDKRSFDSFCYDAGHVATHLLDLLSTYPKDAVIAYVGVRRDLLKALAQGLAGLGFEYRILTPVELATRLATARSRELQAVPADELLEAADVMLFEFGLVRDETGKARDPHASTSLNANEISALETVAEIFRQAVALERKVAAGGGSARMLVTINAVHTRYEPMVASSLAATPSPYTTRLRYGPVLADPGMGPAQRRPLALAVQTAAGIERPVTLAELGAARAHLRTLLSGDDIEPAMQLDIAAAGTVVEGLVKAPPIHAQLGDSIPKVLERLTRCRAPAGELRHLALDAESGSPEKGQRAMSGLARLSDWFDPEWYAAARRVSASGARGTIPRNGWVWERAQLIWGLTRLLGTAPAAHMLVVCERSDAIVPALAPLARHIDLGDIRTLLGREEPKLNTLVEFGAGAATSQEKFAILGASGRNAVRYEAIVLPHSVAFREGSIGLARVIACLRDMMAPGGTLAMAGEVSLLGPCRASRPDLAALGEDGLGRALADRAGLRLIGGVRWQVSARDAALVGTAEGRDAGRPVMGLRRDGDVLWPAAWFFRAEGESPAGLVDGLLFALAAPLLGDQTAAMHTTGLSRRNGSGIVGLAGAGPGHVVFGPFLRLPAGHYRARLQIDETRHASRTRSPIKLVAEVAVGPEIVVQKDVPVGARRSPRATGIELPFEVPRRVAVDGLSPPCEIRLWSDGQAEISIRSVRLDPVESDRRS